MKLYAAQVKSFAEELPERVSDAEIKMIKKKSGHNTLRFFLPLFSGLLVIMLVSSFFFENDLGPIAFIALLLLGPLSVDLLKHDEVFACYGVVTEKTVRCKKVTGRGTGEFTPYESTEECGHYKHRYTLSYTVCDYYYCSVMINGQTYENVYCKPMDYPKINVGDTVIISINAVNDDPVVYACGKR